MSYSLRSRRRVLAERNEQPSDQLKIDFPVRRKRQQENIVVSKVTSPSKRDKTCDASPPTVCKAPIQHLSRNDSTKLEKVKSAFHSNPPTRITCREKEIDCLQSFLLSHIGDHVPGSLYISGPPGTGKTATLMYLLDQHKDLLSNTDVAVINCMSFNTPQDLYERIAVELGLRKNITEKKLVDHITSTQSMILLVLDEIDQCGQQALYRLFEWPSLTSSRIILIGIANSLDLTDRVLPHLKARHQTTPELLIFPPYSNEDIFKILKDRLDTVPDGTSIIDTSALQFCARKVSAVDGDIRQALDISRRAIELIQMNTDTKSHSESVKVNIGHVTNVISEVHECGKAVSTEKIPLQQRLVLCSIIVGLKTKSTKEILLGKLYAVYVQICQNKKIRGGSQIEFMSLLDLLEAQGMIMIKKGKERSHYKVSLKQEESKLTHLLCDQTLLSSILEKGL